MDIRKITAYVQGEKKQVFVSPRMKNDGCDDFQTHKGWWWCIVGGCVGTFVTIRPESGCRLTGINEQTKIEESELDVFTADPINTKEDFERLLTL